MNRFLWEQDQIEVAKADLGQFAEPGEHHGNFIGVWLEPGAAADLAVDGGEPPEELHITLLYDPNGEPEDLPAILAAVGRIALEWEELDGVVNGRGRFYGDGQDVIYAAPDVPGLSGLREELVRALPIEEMDVSQHGWTPHITLQYIDPDAPTPFSEPLAFAESLPIRITAITVKRGDFRVDIPLQPAADPFDMSGITEVEEYTEWTEETLLRFAEWFGYTIEPNPDSSLGFAVTSPSGKRLGGFVAKNVIAAWQKNPTGEAAPKKGKAGAKGKSGGKAKAAAKPKKTPEQREAEKAAAAAMKLEDAKLKADSALLDIDTVDMALRSKGKLNAADLQSFVDEAKGKLKSAATPKEVTAILKEMRRNIMLYKREMTKPPTPDVQLAQTKAKLKNNLPSAKVLAGTKFDESEVQGIIDKHSKMLDGAASPEEAQRAIKEMRKAIAEYKVDKAKEQAERKKRQAEQKKAISSKRLALTNPEPPAEEPVTASEWADWFARSIYLAPLGFATLGQPRDRFGKWTKGGSFSTSRGEVNVSAPVVERSGSTVKVTMEMNSQVEIPSGPRKGETFEQYEGEAMVRARIGEGELKIVDISVKEAARGQGIATDLVSELAGVARSEGLRLTTSGVYSSQGKALFESFVSKGKASRLSNGAHEIDLNQFSEVPAQFMAPGQPRDRMGKWTKGGGTNIGAAESQALMNYGMGDALSINTILRRGTAEQIASSRFAKDIDLLDSAIAKSPLPAATEVHRVGHIGDYVPGGPLPKVGDVLQDKGFVSTSVSATQGKSAYGPVYTSSAEFIISLPKGAKAASVSPNELLLPRNSKFKVTGIDGGMVRAELA